jgi:ADP-ribosyl-[dinitrogen reductase] hydrolase
MTPDQAAGTLIGLAIGDALGATNEFQKYPTYVTDLIGGGPFNLKAGTWTDDTSMALALGDSLRFMQRFNYKDQLDRYILWYKNGAYNAANKCIGSGSHTRKSLETYLRTGETVSQDEWTGNAGNGSLMRLAPIPIFYRKDRALSMYWAGQSSKTTHAAPQCVDACRYFAQLIHLICAGATKAELLSLNDIDLGPLQQDIKNVARINYLTERRSDVVNPSGYVASTLAAALWCFHNSGNFRDGAVLAANLGGDTDTVAAVYGQLAGAFYGLTDIPQEWIDKLAWKDWIMTLAFDLYKMAPEK